MSASTTQFRTAVQATLAAAYGFEFVGGIIKPPQTNKAIGCVWHEGKRPMGVDGNEEECYYRVRVFELFKQNQGETNATLAVSALEQSEETLQTTLRAVLLTSGHDFFKITEATIDYDGQFVEAQLLAYQRNLGAAGG